MGAPATLPANFTGWDPPKAGPPDTLPPDFSGWDDEAPQQGPRASGFLGTLGREASSLGRNIAGIPGGIYHAFADQPTPAEQSEYPEAAETRPGIANRAALGVERLSGQPLVNAVKWYRDAAQGKVPDPVGQALSVAPEGVGAGAAAVVAPELAARAPGAVGGLASAVREAAPNLGAKAAALGKVGAQYGISKIPVAGGFVRRPSYGDWFNAARAKADPSYVQSAPLGRAPVPQAAPASVSGEALGAPPVPRQPLVQQMRQSARAPLVEQMRTSAPTPEPEMAAPPASLVEQVRQWPPEPEVAAPQSRLVDRMQEGTEEQDPSLKVKATKDYPRLVEQVTRPVTENPVVGSFVRAMQKSGMPIAKRPNLLLKGSGRVNRILGPNEDLTDILGKSARQARRAREQ